jgi:ABC-type polysaccharide/polyol phosphate export permease
MEHPHRNRQLKLELVWALVRRDVRARTSQSALGYLWAFLKPIFLTAILYVVFGTILPVRVPTEQVPYWLHLLVSILTWNFFLGALTEATHSIVAHGHLIKKVPLDARVFPLAAVLSHSLNYAAAMSLVLILAIPLSGIPWNPLNWLMMIPAILCLGLLALGLGLLLAAAQVWLRDTASALELGATAWFYGSPVIYPLPLALTALEIKLSGFGPLLYLCNPVVAPLTLLRRALLYPPGAELPDTSLFLWCAASFILGLGVIALANHIYRIQSGNFSDRL